MKKLVGFAFLVLLSACYQRLTEKDLQGTYFVSWSFGTEKLILRPGGKYRQEIKIDESNERLAHEGTWYYDAKYRNAVLVDALPVATATGSLDPGYKMPFPGHTLCGVTQFPPWAGIRLDAGVEGIYMKRISGISGDTIEWR